MTKLLELREKLDTETRLKSILDPFFKQEHLESTMTASDIITLLNKESDPQMVYKLCHIYIQHWQKISK